MARREEKTRFKAADERGTLSVARRAKITGWRGDLSATIFSVNESELVHNLRGKYRAGEPWTNDEVSQFSDDIEKIVLVASEVHGELAKFIKRGGRLIENSPKMEQRYLDRLSGALRGISFGISYLYKLTPSQLSNTISEYLGDEEADTVPGLVDMLFMGFCPVGVKQIKDLPSSSAKATLEEHLEVLKVKESVASDLGLDGIVNSLRVAQEEIVSQLRSSAVAGGIRYEMVYENGGCYTNGIKALRASVMQLTYTVTAKDIYRIDLNHEDSRWWHESVSDQKSPPADLVTTFQSMADEDGRVLRVYDNERELVREFVPASFHTAGLKEKAALKQSKRARQQWEYHFWMAKPSDPNEFQAALTEDELKRVRKLFADYPDRTFTISEVSALANVKVHARTPTQQERFLKRMEAAQKVTLPRPEWLIKRERGRRAAAESAESEARARRRAEAEESAFRAAAFEQMRPPPRFTPLPAATWQKNPGYDELADIVQSEGIISALWSMDLD